MTAGPDWLERFQREFGEAIRTPLERRGALARAAPHRYPAHLREMLAPSVVGAPLEGLAHYNRQYWFRLLGALQREHPLTLLVCGTSAFVDLAVRFFTAHPPRGHDLGAALAPFAGFLEDEPLEELAPRARAVHQAVAIDRAFRQVFEAPLAPPLDLRGMPGERLARARFVRSERVRIVAEDWELLALRGRDASASPHLLTPRAERAHWIIAGSASGPRVESVASERARLYELLGEAPLGPALERLEAEVSDVDGSLPARVRAWIAQAVELGLWSEVVLT